MKYASFDINKPIRENMQLTQKLKQKLQLANLANNFGAYICKYSISPHFTNSCIANAENKELYIVYCINIT